MIKRNKITSLLIGSAVGDALGVPYEFMARGTFDCTGMVGYGSHNQPLGTWSDDTSMTLALADQIADGFSLEGLGQKFLRWYNKGEYTSDGTFFDIGGATTRAISKIARGVPANQAGGKEEWDNGNGSLMRIAPLVFYSTKYEDVADVSSVTHGHTVSVKCCYAYIKLLEELLLGTDKHVAYSNVLKQISTSEFLSNLLVPNLAERSEKEIKSGGYVADTLKASIWCFLTTDNYKDAVLKAVNLGSDTDTTACVTGAIAGLYYGIDSIPKEWIDSLRNKELVYDIANRMADKLEEK